MNLTPPEIARARLWRDRVAALEKQQAPLNATLFVGSSSIGRWASLSEDFPELTTINHGFGGSHLSDSVYYFEPLVLAPAPQTVVVYAGDNDIAAGKSAARVVEHFVDFQQLMQAHLPDTKLVFLSIKPGLARWSFIETVRRCNAEIEELCKNQERSQFVDLEPAMLSDEGRPRPELFVEDGIHLSREGYHVWTQCLRPFLIA